VRVGAAGDSAATASATCKPALTMACVTGAAPKDWTTDWPCDPRTYLMNAASAVALGALSPDVGTTR
jgi:hypothetical protein